MGAYLDHAATTPLRPEAREAWLAAGALVGNASSVHGAGQRARRALEDARERIAATLGCEPIEVVLTSGGTEAVNLALKGLWWARSAGRDAVALPDGEHHATLDAVEWLRRAEGARVTPIALDERSRIAPAAFDSALSDPRVAVATALVANNETGAVHDAPALATAAARSAVPLHLDAVAAVGHVGVGFRRWRGDAPDGAGLVALSVSGHKVGAPVGTGALVVSRTIAPQALLHGGDQQRGLRSGTQDVAGAVALATALEIAERERESEAARLTAIRNRLIGRLRAAVPELEVLGDPERTLPGTIHLHLPGATGESMLFLLDQHGISVSTGSACQAGVSEPSHVVLAMGRTEAEARQVLRISLGRTTTDADADALVAALPEAYRRLTVPGVRSGARS
ncbi:cysteine desulfurase family protein [Microbacterium oryzae]|uniref:Cysteine desulfurase n=1 Tax=Microbacterium oryzae TaxID=743009 RepID=A0A6I6DY79_9MICO|nr:cysteine desulfurase family protein [Microbacterium oryzae]QGU26934.1 cysteine desulfurase [Microbacterium oryzae]